MYSPGASQQYNAKAVTSDSWLRRPRDRFFKYFNQRIANLAYAVLLCARELRDFLVVLFLMTFAFAIAFHTAFGIDVRENRTLPTTIFELFELFAKGNISYEEIPTTIFELFELFAKGNMPYDEIIILSFIVIKLPAAILIRSFSNTRDKGVDDPMSKGFRAGVDDPISKEFRTAVLKIISRAGVDDPMSKEFRAAVLKIISRAGVDDPMSKEFRAVVIKIISRAVKAVFYSGVKDEKKLFREEREKELEVALDQKKLFHEECEKELEAALDQAAETAAAAAAVRNVDKPRTIKQTVKLIHNQVTL
ncbi:hypothetical protein T484DRAFT_1790393 [Baffinella frigidus]|nr:hypothetical protein T484DRAFT_1790393 [Cryptophyta sp. CCMP2293]